MNAIQMENYISCIREKLKEALNKNSFIGKLETEINIKDGGITNMNIALRESVKI